MCLWEHIFCCCCWPLRTCLRRLNTQVHTIQAHTTYSVYRYLFCYSFTLKLASTTPAHCVCKHSTTYLTLYHVLHTHICTCTYIFFLTVYCTVQVKDRVLFEGVLKIYWGVKNALILAPGAAYAKQRHNHQSIYDFVGVDDGAYLMMLEEASKARMRRELQDGEKKRLREITENSVLMSTAGQLWLSFSWGVQCMHTVHAYSMSCVYICVYACMRTCSTAFESTTCCMCNIRM